MPPKTPGQKDFVIRLPDDLHEALRKYARRQERTMASAVRFILRDRLNAPVPPEENDG